MWYNKGASSTKIFYGCSASGMSLGLGPRYRVFDSPTSEIIIYGVRGRVVECADLWSRNTNIAGANPVGHPLIWTFLCIISVSGSA